MKRDSLDERLKKLTILGVVFSCLATTPIVLLFIIGYVGIVPMLVGVSVTFLFVASVVFFARSSMATWASETQGDASNLAEIASAMARGDFSVQLEVSDELDQIKLALEHLSTVQKSLVRDIDTLTRNGGAIDEKNYSGEFLETARKINAIISAHSGANAAVVASLKSLESGEYKASPATGRTEINVATDDLWKKFELIMRELQVALATAEEAKKDAASAREDAAAARRETMQAKDDAANARREASNAATDASNARREAAAATRRAERFRPAGVPGGAAPPIRTIGVHESAPATSSLPARTRFTTPGATMPALKSTKIVAPSGAHEYDRKDYGKY